MGDRARGGCTELVNYEFRNLLMQPQGLGDGGREWAERQAI
jgi:hypothetical protein